MDGKRPRQRARPGLHGASLVETNEGLPALGPRAAGPAPEALRAGAQQPWEQGVRGGSPPPGGHVQGTHSGDAPTPGCLPPWSRVPAHLHGRPTQSAPDQVLKRQLHFLVLLGAGGPRSSSGRGRPRGSPWCVTAALSLGRTSLSSGGDVPAGPSPTRQPQRAGPHGLAHSPSGRTRPPNMAALGGPGGWDFNVRIWGT